MDSHFEEIQRVTVNDEGKPFLKKYASVTKKPDADSEYCTYYVNILIP